MVITRLSWTWSAYDSPKCKLPFDFKGVVSRVGAGLWETLVVNNTELQSDDSYRRWANLEASRLMREFLDVPRRVRVTFGFQSVSVNIYILEANGEHFCWNDHGVDPADDQYETSLVFITSHSYVWKDGGKGKEQDRMIHVVFRFNANRLSTD